MFTTMFQALRTYDSLHHMHVLHDTGSEIYVNLHDVYVYRKGAVRAYMQHVVIRGRWYAYRLSLVSYA